MSQAILGQTVNTGQATLDHVTITKLGTKTMLDTNSVAGGLLSGIPWDYVSVTYPSATQEVYVFRNGTGAVTGTIVATVTVNYVTSTKARLLNAARV